MKKENLNFVVKNVNTETREQLKVLLLNFKAYEDVMNNYSLASYSSEGDPYCYYGFINNRFDSYCLSEITESKIKILSITDLEKMIKSGSMQDYQIVAKTKDVKIKGLERKLTVAVLNVGGIIKTGYSICLPEDKFDKELSVNIAKGRALKDKTNLTPEMIMGIGMDKKYILYAIAENTINQIERGTLEIKGIRAKK